MPGDSREEMAAEIRRLHVRLELADNERAERATLSWGDHQADDERLERTERLATEKVRAVTDAERELARFAEVSQATAEGVKAAIANTLQEEADRLADADTRTPERLAEIEANRMRILTEEREGAAEVGAKASGDGTLSDAVKMLAGIMKRMDDRLDRLDRPDRLDGREAAVFAIRPPRHGRVITGSQQPTPPDHGKEAGGRGGRSEL